MSDPLEAALQLVVGKDSGVAPSTRTKLIELLNDAIAKGLDQAERVAKLEEAFKLERGMKEELENRLEDQRSKGEVLKKLFEAELDRTKKELEEATQKKADVDMAVVDASPSPSSSSLPHVAVSPAQLAALSALETLGPRLDELIQEQRATKEEVQLEKEESRKLREEVTRRLPVKSKKATQHQAAPGASAVTAPAASSAVPTSSASPILPPPPPVAFSSSSSHAFSPPTANARPSPQTPSPSVTSQPFPISSTQLSSEAATSAAPPSPVSPEIPFAPLGSSTACGLAIKGLTDAGVGSTARIFSTAIERKQDQEQEHLPPPAKKQRIEVDNTIEHQYRPGKSVNQGRDSGTEDQLVEEAGKEEGAGETQLRSAFSTQPPSASFAPSASGPPPAQPASGSDASTTPSTSPRSPVLAFKPFALRARPRAQKSSDKASFTPFIVAQEGPATPDSGSSNVVKKRVAPLPSASKSRQALGEAILAQREKVDALSSSSATAAATSPTRPNASLPPSSSPLPSTLSPSTGSTPQARTRHALPPRPPRPFGDEDGTADSQEWRRAAAFAVDYLRESDLSRCRTTTNGRDISRSPMSPLSPSLSPFPSSSPLQQHQSSLYNSVDGGDNTRLYSMGRRLTSPYHQDSSGVLYRDRRPRSPSPPPFYPASSVNGDGNSAGNGDGDGAGGGKRAASPPPPPPPSAAPPMMREWDRGKRPGGGAAGALFRGALGGGGSGGGGGGGRGK